jgi:hypothetical protein
MNRQNIFPLCIIREHGDIAGPFMIDNADGTRRVDSGCRIYYVVVPINQ